MTLPTLLKTSVGEQVRLGKEIARGGEGAVFDVAGDAAVVAKIYLSTPSTEKADKLRAMAQGTTDRLQAIAAWPIETLHDSSGVFRGFLMKRVSRQKDIHVLYGPKTRLREYPDASYAFLLRVAGNVARAFAVVHEHGHVIGDVNQGGVCVASNGVVTLVDCDSFQITSRGRRFTCDVGIPLYQPPEFQTLTSFRGLQREERHDTFGLATLIFQTLFLARHPFAGSWLGPDELPLEQAIAERRFAYGPGAASRKMRQPPGTLGLDCIPSGVASLFERAFLADAHTARPTAREWAAALDDFEKDLRPCATNQAHAFVKGRSTCPLCEIEAKGRTLLFVPPQQASVSSPPLKLEELLREIDALHLEADEAQQARPALMTLAPSVPPSALDAQAVRQRRSANALVVGGFFVAALALFVSAYFSIGFVVVVVLALFLRGFEPPEVQTLRDQQTMAQRNLTAAYQLLEVKRLNNPAPALKASAQSLTTQIAVFDRQHIDKQRAFEHGAQQRQRLRYLDGFAVEDCGVKGFGRGLLQTLVSYGIDSAADVDVESLQQVPGFGSKRINALLEWRAEIERRFRFHPNDPNDARDRALLERDASIARLKLVKQLPVFVQQLKVSVATFKRELNDARAVVVAADASAQTYRAMPLDAVSARGFVAGIAGLTCAGVIGTAIAMQPGLVDRYVVGEDTIVRETPSPTGREVKRVVINTRCSVRDEPPPPSEYVEVTCGEVTGFIHAALLSPVERTVEVVLAEARAADAANDLVRALHLAQNAVALSPSSAEAVALCHKLFWDIELRALRQARLTTETTRTPAALRGPCRTEPAQCLLTLAKKKWSGAWHALHIDGDDFCVAIWSTPLLTVHCGGWTAGAAGIKANTEFITESPLGRFPAFGDGSITGTTAAP